MESEDELFLKHEREEAKECFFRLAALGACLIEVLAENHESLLNEIRIKYNEMCIQYENSREINEE